MKRQAVQRKKRSDCDHVLDQREVDEYVVGDAVKASVHCFGQADLVVEIVDLKVVPCLVYVLVEVVVFENCLVLDGHVPSQLVVDHVLVK